MIEQQETEITKNIKIHYISNQITKFLSLLFGSSMNTPNFEYGCVIMWNMFDIILFTRPRIPSFWAQFACKSNEQLF